MSVQRFQIQSTREAWARVFYDIREGDIQWIIPDFKSEKIAAQGDKLSFLILLGIIGLQPYNQSRVMRHLGRTKITGTQGDTTPFVVDYNRNDKIPFAMSIIKE